MTATKKSRKATRSKAPEAKPISEQVKKRVKRIIAEDRESLEALAKGSKS